MVSYLLAALMSEDVVAANECACLIFDNNLPLVVFETEKDERGGKKQMTGICQVLLSFFMFFSEGST